MLKPRLRATITIAEFGWVGDSPDDLMERCAQLAQTAEESGFQAAWVMDHFHQLGGDPAEWMPEGPTLLAALAGRTKRIQLGLMVGGVTYRNPALLAKMTTTLDVLSGGRAILGIGAAWHGDEHHAYGFAFPSLRERFEHLEDAVRIARAMFTEDRPSVQGTHHSIDQPYNNPRPIRGDVPILIGGSGERKTLRLVAQYGDACNVFATGEEARRLMGVLDQHCADVGRDPAGIERTTFASVVVAPTHEQAHRKLEALRSAQGEGRDYYEGALVGDPDEVAEQAAALRQMGVDGIVAAVPDMDDLESVALAGRALST